MWRLVIATAAGAYAGAAIARRAAAATEGEVTLVFVMAIAKDKHLTTIVVIFRAASGTAAVFSEHPHKEGGVAVELEVKGAPLAQATSVGKCLPTVSQGHVPGDGNLQRNPRGSAAAAVRLKPEPISGTSR